MSAIERSGCRRREDHVAAGDVPSAEDPGARAGPVRFDLAHPHAGAAASETSAGPSLGPMPR
jgi:hypothetical protein